MYFRYFVITSLWKRAELRSTKDSLCKDWLKLAQWFWRSRLLNFVNVLLLFSNYMPLEKGKALHMNKNESPLPKYALCQVWLALEKKFFLKFRQCIFAILLLSPLGKERGISFKQT